MATVEEGKRDPLIETRFGGYLIIEHLGKGGMGDVYRALQIGLERPVALKILPSLLARSTEFSERFFTEAFAISRLQHQNIVTIYDYGEEGGQKYIAMQYVQGPTLSRLIHDERKLDYPRIVGIAKQICRGLKYAHQNEIVHRDIKSGNIMVEAGDKIYISDFGIAKVVDAPSITTTGMAMGTPEYMAPEQCEGGMVDGQSDIYGLGIILYEMVAGKPPFLADTPLAVAYKQVHETPPLLSKRCPDVPPRLELIVAKCLKKNKSERYRTAEELLVDLDSAHLEAVPQPAIDKATPSDFRITDRRENERRYGPEMVRKHAYVWGSVALSVFIAGSLAYLFLRPSHPDPEGLRWIRPLKAESPSDSPASAASLDPLFDSDGATAWIIPGNRAVAEIQIVFPGHFLLTGLAVEAGFPDPNTGTVASAPRYLVVEAEGRKPLRFSLTDSEAPQFFPLGGILAENIRLRLLAPEISAKAMPGATAGAAPSMAVREMRFLGLPYE